MPNTRERNELTMMVAASTARDRRDIPPTRSRSGGWRASAKAQAGNAARAWSGVLRRHGAAIEDAAAAAVVLDALVLDHAVIPDRERALGPRVTAGGRPRLLHSSPRG